jgi:hypothetical protein
VRFAAAEGEGSTDRFGRFIALSSDGSKLFVGAPRNDNASGGDAGHLRIFEFGGSSLSRIFADIDGEAAGDRSGRSVSISSSGDRVAIGAPLNDNAGGNDSGHVRVYHPPIFDDGFESGNSLGWAITVSG